MLPEANEPPDELQISTTPSAASAPTRFIGSTGERRITPADQIDSACCALAGGEAAERAQNLNAVVRPPMATPLWAWQMPLRKIQTT
jgi:hypothetical protein